MEFLVYNPAQPLLFNCGQFLFLFLAFYAVFILLRRRILVRTVYLLGFSWFFYYKTSGSYLAILLINTLGIYLAGNFMHRQEKQSGRRLWLILGLLLSLGALCWFKYTNFIISGVSALFSREFRPLDIFLPIGISFYTFQILSYLIDVYRRRISPAGSLLDFSLFVAFFPQLVAGPIVRAHELLPQIGGRLEVNSARQARAFFLLAGGLFKKAVLADYLAANFVDRVFEDPGLYGGLETLLAVYGYAIQIYGDFSGYSDMAIGLGLLMGFTLPENFNAPYLASSVTDFWRRWHMTLSAWLRDYVYISLGGNRLGRARTYANLMVTMLIGGLWHGAGISFVAWGGMHGAALAVERAFRGRLQVPERGPLRWIAMLATFHFVCLGWIFFRAGSFGRAMLVLERIFSGIDLGLLAEFQYGYPLILPFLILGFLMHLVPRNWEGKVVGLYSRTPLVFQAAALAAVIFAVIQAKSAAIQPYIYFQF